MKKKMITMGIVGIFLLTSLLVGTAVGRKTTQATSDQGDDLAIEIVTNKNSGKVTSIIAKVTNKGTETVYGPIAVNRNHYVGFFNDQHWDVQVTFYILPDGQGLNPGDSVSGGEWYIDRSHPEQFIIYPVFNTFKYELKDYNDGNLNNNKDSHRYLILFKQMFYAF